MASRSFKPKELYILTEKQVVANIKTLRKKQFPTKRDNSKLEILVTLHEKGKAVGYTSVKYTPTFLEEKVEALQKEPFPLTEELENTDELKRFEKLHEIAKVGGYATEYDGTVFHYGGRWLFTCAHVVGNEEWLRGTSVTFEWIDMNSEEPETHTCAHGCRKGIYTQITRDENKIDLALFQDDQVNVNALKDLPSIQSKSIVDAEWEYTGSSVELVPTAELVTPSKDDTLYQIYWDLPDPGTRQIPTKKFCITKKTTPNEMSDAGIGIDDIEPGFPFNSPAPDGASGSPVMVYRKVYKDENGDKEFCLVGIMSGGEKEGYIQVAELPESIQQYSQQAMQFNSIYHRLVHYGKLSDQLKSDDKFKAKIHKNQQEIEKEIKDYLRVNGLKGIFLGSLCIRDDEIAAN